MSIATSVAIILVIGVSFPAMVVEESNVFLHVLKSILKVWCVGGLFSSLLYKEAMRKNEYYFYYNAGISKIMLFTITFALYILFSLLIYSLCALIISYI